jgi:hypothetical protein
LIVWVSILAWGWGGWGLMVVMQLFVLQLFVLPGVLVLDYAVLHLYCGWAFSCFVMVLSS